MNSSYHRANSEEAKVRPDLEDPSPIESIPVIDENHVTKVTPLNSETIPAAVKEYDLPEPSQSSNSDLSNKPVPLTVWLILIISSLGVFMASVSTSALIIAFPTLLADLDMTINTTMWVLLILLLMIGAVVPTAGKLGDILSQALIYKIGFYFFTFGSLGAGFVEKKNQGFDLIAARIVIGFGAALLFTNSSAILTHAFAPYNKVGLSQGVFQLFSALGIVLGPLIGGGFAQTNWRWIFWFNAPVGGFCSIAATFLVQDKIQHNDDAGTSNKKSTWERLKDFDIIGSITCSFGLILILIAMIQGVSPLPALSSAGALAGLIIGGCVFGLIFIIDQFYAKDPLIPPEIFYDKIYTLTTITGTLMAFVRNSITYDMIFFLQGPYNKTPLQAGIALIPYGIGIMSAGFVAGAIADKVGMRNMAMIGPICTLTACSGLAIMDEHTPYATVEGLLYLAGVGIGIFQSSNMTANMLSVEPNKRGVAAAVSMLTMTFCMMVGIVLTFSFVLNSMSSEQLYDLFIYGGSSGIPVRKTLDAIALDYYIIIAFCAATTFTAWCLPTDLNQILKAKHARKPVETDAKSQEETPIESQSTKQLVDHHTNDDDKDEENLRKDLEEGGNNGGISTRYSKVATTSDKRDGFTDEGDDVEMVVTRKHNEELTV